MPSEGFEPAIPAVMRLHTYSLDRTVTGIGMSDLLNLTFKTPNYIPSAIC
jgi:hypothetical protein